jgi:pyrophosphatase PpaX
MFGPIQAAIFDFDGTLVDTMPNVVMAITEAIRSQTGETVTEAQLKTAFGPPPLDVLKKFVPETHVAAAYDVWLRLEKQAIPEFFPGVEKMLETLQSQKISLGLFTGRDRAGTLRILETLGWKGRFFEETNIVCGDDGISPKPHPEGVLRHLKRLKMAPDTVLMVGDHPYDILAGHEAGTRTGAVLWDIPREGGTFRSRYRAIWSKWDDFPCDLRFESPLSLARWVTESSKD